MNLNSISPPTTQPIYITRTYILLSVSAVWWTDESTDIIRIRVIFEPKSYIGNYGSVSLEDGTLWREEEPSDPIIARAKVFIFRVLQCHAVK